MDMILPPGPTGPFMPALPDGGLMPVGERCGFFLLTGDLVECFGKILAWFASLLGQPDKLNNETRSQSRLLFSTRAAFKKALLNPQ